MATDLDGTLLRSDGTVSERTRRALAQVEAAGSTVAFATGRPPRWMRPIAEATGHRGVAICSNGAVVYDLHQEQVIEEYLLAPDILVALVEAIRGAVPGVAFGVEFGHRFGHEVGYATLGDVAGEVYVAAIDDLLSKPAAKLLVRHDGHDADVLLDKAREAAGDLAELTHSSRMGLLEISALGISKATTLAAFCRRQGIEPKDVVAFGDMPNDLAMLGWAGTAYAMAGAHPTVLAAVERRCPPNDEDGVAHVLERLYDGVYDGTA